MHGLQPSEALDISILNEASPVGGTYHKQVIININVEPDSIMILKNMCILSALGAISSRIH